MWPATDTTRANSAACRWDRWAVFLLLAIQQPQFHLAFVVRQVLVGHVLEGSVQPVAFGL